MKAVCRAVSLQDGNTEISCARGRKSGSQGSAHAFRVTPGLGSVRKEKCLLVSSPFNTWVCVVIFSFEGLSSKQAVGKIPLVAWMLLASF